MADFAPEEYRARLHRAQAMMAREGLAALLLTTEPEVRYFTGFLTRFWESPARPWFLIVPASGDPVAVIPSIGAHLMGQSWISDIRTWRSPQPGDDGISLLRDALAEVGGPIGVPSGPETHLRMPLDTWAALQSAVRFRDDAGIMRRLRLIKSDAEIDRIATICQIANAAFDRVPEVIGAGLPLSEVFRRFQILLLTEGADWVPYLAGAAGQGGYGDVISPATDAPLMDGDVLMLDTGAVRAGYFCDFDRNFAVGNVDQAARDANARLIEATEAGFEAAQAGATAADLFHAMDRVVTGGAGGSDAGRLGHGLGMQLTEWPSLIAADHTVLEPGMVLTLEPGIALAPGRILVHEENIVITADGPQWLSIPSDEHMVQL
ncbi:Xaa-Pro peptidase family protein [Pseudosulfitobacter sp. DSM 107133]|uniref:M24 family metallopeptidase n=1 Tax=Pseudosulfitobacter sp. DSM 107133 TaxID=2883100 RepID=UPI000DF36C0C|nr:Xaa-Pro peptidase family protein [Pseudosulfitobacter sp. DSM 107133]UOA26280.1 putative dipeptidase PepE [Pseudosulfitobacter sp. DSM 107133]